MEEVWREVKSTLQAGIPDHAYNIWIEPLQLYSVQNGTITLSCPNHFFLKWVRENYAASIRKAWESCKGDSVKVELRLAPRQRQAKPLPEEVGQLKLNLPVQTNGYHRRLNQRFTFDEFVVGRGNDFAFFAARAMAEGRAHQLRNSLYLLSGTGLGKSHLSSAIGNHILGQRPRAMVRYLTAEEFTNEMVVCIKQNRIEAFKDKYRRKCDVLILEEVQFLSGKEKTQLELAYTLDALCRDNKLVVFTGNHFPKDIPRLKSRLQSRLTAGMVTHIEPPDYPTRLKILERKAATEGVHLPEEVKELIASKISGDVRQLESCIIGMVAKSSLLGSKIDLNLAEEVLESVCDSHQSVTVEGIVRLICDYFKVTPEALKSNSRRKTVVYPRNLCMYLCRKYTEETLETIGRTFNRTHATVIYAVDKIHEQMQRKSGVYNQVQFLCDRLTRQPLVL
ncbi:MAG: chromosomal replication initiator protein DnaA [Deltaproteobacteria bacterium]|nr:chromosomal replication initiator protein DnaA [Deltaproteobacteria bacterium]MBW2072489.1 chromosomal replication initiator protein DnaA [Deltaproteobacteria bacterium]